MKFSKSGDEWVVLDEAKNVIFSHPDRDVALAEFKKFATKPRPTSCTHANRTGYERRFSHVGTPPVIDTSQWREARMFVTSWSGPDRDEEDRHGEWITWPERLILIVRDPGYKATYAHGVWCRDCGEQLSAQIRP